MSKAKGGLEVTAQLSGIRNMFCKQLKALLCLEQCIFRQMA